MYCDGSLDEGEYTVEALMLSRGQGGSRKTFLVLRVSAILFLLLDPIFASMRVWFALFLFSDPGCSSLLALCQPFFHSLRVWHAIFLLLDPIFASMRVWFALFLFSDPGCSSLLALYQPFSILSGSGTRFFSSGTSPFPSISLGFQFV